LTQFLAVPQLHVTRTLSGNSVPVIAWVTGGASSAIRIFGPEPMGGLGNLGCKIDAEAARTGKRPEEIGDQVRVCLNIPSFRGETCNRARSDLQAYRRDCYRNSWSARDVRLRIFPPNSVFYLEYCVYAT
jgi:hypothetical protein